MKRAIWWNVAMTGLVALSVTACSPASQGSPQPSQTEVPSSDWNQTPSIEAVQVTGRSLQLSGSAQPGARVVLRSEAGAAYAAVTNDQGQFELRIEAPSADLWLKPETQVGQNAAMSPDILMIPANGQGPIAVLRSGGPTRRLDSSPALGAVDSDGRARRLSGRAAPGTESLPIVVGAITLQAFPDASGVWNVVLGPEAGSDQITVGGQTFIWPGHGSPDGQGWDRERAGTGWRVAWTENGARQTVWLPDAG